MDGIEFKVGGVDATENYDKTFIFIEAAQQKFCLKITEINDIRCSATIVSPEKYQGAQLFVSIPIVAVACGGGLVNRNTGDMSKIGMGFLQNHVSKFLEITNKLENLKDWRSMLSDIDTAMKEYAHLSGEDLEKRFRIEVNYIIDKYYTQQFPLSPSVVQKYFTQALFCIANRLARDRQL